MSDVQTVASGTEKVKVKLSNNETVDVDAPTAHVILTVLNALDDENKKKMSDLLSSNRENFLKVAEFSWKNIE